MPSYYHITEIDWDTDGEESINLPKMLRVDKHLEPELCDENISDWLSDRYGFCVNGCNFEIGEYNDENKEINKLKEEIKELKGNIAEGVHLLEHSVCKYQIANDENKEINKLTAEIKKLKEDIEKKDKWAVDAVNDMERYIKEKDDMEKEYEVLKAENEELKSLTQNKINEAVISEPMVGKLYVDIAKLIEVVESKDKTIKWWKETILNLLGWDEDEGAKWNSPHNFDVKVRDIMEELEGRLNPSNEERDPETGEVIKKKEDDKKKDRREEILNKLHRQIENPFHPVGFEKADNENDTKYFQKVIDDRHLNEALFHMKMTEPVFGEYKNFRRFINEMNKPKAGK